MTLEITDIFGNRVELQPRVELYSVRDFMGQEMPGLAIALDEIVDEPYGMEPYTATVVAGETTTVRRCVPAFDRKGYPCPSRLSGSRFEPVSGADLTLDWSFRVVRF